MNIYLFKEVEGFTLIEIILSISIISIVLILLLSFFSGSTVFINETAVRSQALEIAETTMEELKAEADRDWDNFLDIAPSFNINNDIFSEMDLFRDYNISVNLSQDDIDGDSEDDEDIRKITITVAWGSNNIQLESLVVKR